MNIRYSKQALKFLNKQDKVNRQRLIDAINKLPNGDIKKLQNRSGYRLRVGSYRVIFDSFGNVWFIDEINNRGQVYK